MKFSRPDVALEKCDRRRCRKPGRERGEGSQPETFSTLLSHKRIGTEFGRLLLLSSREQKRAEEQFEVTLTKTVGLGQKLDICMS